MPARTPRQRLPSADRRQQILAAGAGLFIERGFEAVTMGDIAAALGTSRPTIYSYFASTDHILAALLDERLDLLLVRLEPLLLAPAAGAEPQLIEPVFQLLLDERETLALLHSGGGPSFRARRHTFLSEIARRLPLDAAVPGSAHPLVLLIITTLLASLASRAASDPELDPAALARTLQLFVRGGVREFHAGETAQGP